MYKKISGRTIIEYNTITLNKDNLVRGFDSIDINKGLAN